MKLNPLLRFVQPCAHRAGPKNSTYASKKSIGANGASPSASADPRPTDTPAICSRSRWPTRLPLEPSTSRATLIRQRGLEETRRDSWLEGDDVNALRDIFTKLLEMSLDPEQTRRLLDDVRRTLWNLGARAPGDAHRQRREVSMPSVKQLSVTTRFYRSSYCGVNGCVEVALLPDHRIAVRDAKDNNPGAPVLLFDQTEWTAFLRGVTAGEFAPEALRERH